MVTANLVGTQVACPHCHRTVVAGPRPNQFSQQTSSGGVPTVVWVLLGIGGVAILSVLLCVGFVGFAMKSAVDAANRQALFFEGKDLLAERALHQPQFTAEVRDDERPAIPPEDQFRIVQYPTKIGDMPAYISIAPVDSSIRQPAIIWIFGGFSNGIGETAWEPASPDNDQSASAFRSAGLVMMYPALRGGSGAPGFMEGFYGEVDDVLAAAEYVRSQPGIDPSRVYLGGHSTGGTLALLCAAASKQKFRAVFAFGGVDQVGGYGQDVLPYNMFDQQESNLRDPVNWIHAIEVPTFAIEGSDGNAMGASFRRVVDRNPNVHQYVVSGADHFSVLAPINRLLAEKVAADTGPSCNITITSDELNQAFRQQN